MSREDVQFIFIIYYQDKYCTAYQFKNKKCKTCKTGKISKEDNDGNKVTISGLCPKVKKKLQDEIKTYEIKGDKWWCNENDNTKKCNFPFKLHGQKYYKPFVTSDGDDKCIALDNTYNWKPKPPGHVIDLENPIDFTDIALVPCSPCPGIN